MEDQALPFWVGFNGHYEEMIAPVQFSSLLPDSPSSLFIEASAARRADAAADPSEDAAITSHSLLCLFALYMCVFTVYVCVSMSLHLHTHFTVKTDQQTHTHIHTRLHRKSEIPI